MGSINTAPEAIPTVDISPFITSASNDASDKTLQEVVEAVRHACTKYGFFYLAGHGVSLKTRLRRLNVPNFFSHFR